MSTRREIHGRIVSQVETDALIERLAQRRNIAEGIVDTIPSPTPLAEGSRASLSITADGRLRVSVGEDTWLRFTTAASSALWGGSATFGGKIKWSN